MEFLEYLFPTCTEPSSDFNTIEEMYRSIKAIDENSDDAV
jgi:hypothetical protein